MRTILLFIALFCFIRISYAQGAKFESQDGKVLLIIGQDLGAIGGFDYPNNDGYYENIGIIPAGTTTYTSLPALNGLKTKDNWGAGDVWAQHIVDNSIFKNTVLTIGLDLAYGQNSQQVSTRLQTIINGGMDSQIEELADWIKATRMPVFLRIGYEFDGEWNNYSKSLYIGAFKRIVTVCRDNQANNMVSVWQSTGRFSKNTLMQWYPGDDYVDWLGYSHFDNYGQGIIDIAREKNKPVLIAEATPRGYDIADDDPTTVWNNWFAPFFQHINDNIDVIKAVAYINQNWDAQRMWSGQGWGDSRVQANETIKQNWINEITSEKWINSSDEVYQQINFDPNTVGINLIEKQKDMLEGTRIFTSKKSIDLTVDNDEFGELNIDVFSISGKDVYHSVKNKNSDYFNCKIGLPVSNGVYLVFIRMNKMRYIKKMVISNR